MSSTRPTSRMAARAAMVPKVAIWLTASLAVLVLDVVDDAVAVALAEVDVEVGHRHPLGVQEALEQQVVLQRVEVGDLERIRHQRAGAGTPARPHRAAVVLGPVDEVAHDQEVAREPHLQDGVDLELQPLHVARHLLVALRRVRVEVRASAPSSPRARRSGSTRRSACRSAWGKSGSLRLAQLQHQVAALGDLERVGHGRGHVGEQLLHLRPADLKYCSRVNLRTRRWLPRISPSEMHTRASCAS